MQHGTWLGFIAVEVKAMQPQCSHTVSTAVLRADTWTIHLQIGVAVKAFSQPNFWLELILIYLATFSARFLERSLRWLFAPNDSMLLVEIEVAREQQAKREAAARRKGRGAPKVSEQEMQPLHKDNDSPPIC